MKDIVFITGNQDKADYLAKYLGYPVQHQKVDLDELQSMDLKKIVEHKVQQTFHIVQKLILVEDVSLEFAALHGLPGPFIKFFVENVPFQTICNMVTKDDRNVVARCVFGYFDGDRLELFESALPGRLPKMPAGDNGFGWDQLFVPEGYNVTRASLGEDDNQKAYLRIKPFAPLKQFFEGLA